MQNSTLFLHTTNEQSEHEIRKIVAYTGVGKSRFTACMENNAIINEE